MAELDEWVSVSIDDRKVIDLANGRVTIHWILAGDATDEWSNLFTPMGNKTGSGEFVLSSIEPEARAGFIAWTVPEADIESANSYVSESVEHTNNRYRQHLIQKAQATAKRDAISAQLAEDKNRLQRKLDSLG